MKVKFNAAKSLNGKAYKKSLVTVVADKLAHTQEFKALVKSGALSIIPKNDAEVNVQKGKDALAQNKAQAAKHAAYPVPGEAHAAAKKAFAEKQAALAAKG
jgi:hypothetical protein